MADYSGFFTDFGGTSCQLKLLSVCWTTMITLQQKNEIIEIILSALPKPDLAQSLSEWRRQPVFVWPRRALRL